jgi:phospholipid transport system substrate-binding protein
MKNLLKIKLLLCLSLMCVFNFALAMDDPVMVLRRMSVRLLNGFEKNQLQLNQPGVICKLVDEIILPHVALNHMAASVVGRAHWLAATPLQRGEFIKEFQYLVITTYSAALSSYDKDKIEFYPLRGGFNHPTVTINSVIIRDSDQRINIAYKVLRDSDSWKIYDFSIEDISLVQSYNAQFAGILSSEGMKGLIQQLREHNEKIRQSNN